MSQRFSSDNTAADAFRLLIRKDVNELINLAFIAVRESFRKQQTELLTNHFATAFVHDFNDVAVEITANIVGQHERAAIGDALVGGAFSDQCAFSLSRFENAPGIIGASYGGAEFDLKLFLCVGGCGGKDRQTEDCNE